MLVAIQLYPPLSNTAGQDRIKLAVPDQSTIGGVLEDLAGHFGMEFRRHIFDTRESIVPAWCAFLNGKPIQLNRPENLATTVHDGDEIAFLLNIAGGTQGGEGNGKLTHTLRRQGDPELRGR